MTLASRRCPERKGGAYACLSGRRWGQYLKAGVRLLAIRRCPKRKGRALACLVDRRFRAKTGREFWGVACPERKGGAYACLSGRRWGQYLKAGVRLLAIHGWPKGMKTEPRLSV